MLGLAISRQCCTTLSASEKSSFEMVIRYATVTVTEREMPAALQGREGRRESVAREGGGGGGGKEGAVRKVLLGREGACCQGRREGACCQGRSDWEGGGMWQGRSDWEGGGMWQGRSDWEGGGMWQGRGMWT